MEKESALEWESGLGLESALVSAWESVSAWELALVSEWESEWESALV